MKQNLLNTETAICQEVEDITALKETMLKLQGAKFEYMEPILNGGSDYLIYGLIMYFVLSNGKMVAIKTYSTDDGSGKLVVNMYSEDKLTSPNIGHQ